MASIVRFVDAVGSTTTRLDMSPDGPNDLRLGEDVDFGRPKLAATTADAATGDGDPYVASRYGNRQISLPLVVPRQSTMALRQTVFTSLARELDRPSNVLMVQPDGASSARWLVTYRAADAASWLRLGAVYTAGTVTVTLDAQPFAYGAQVPVTIGQVSGNPETGTWIYTLPFCAGDVDSPLTLDLYNPGSAPPAQQFILATRPVVYSPTGTTYVVSTPSSVFTNVTTGVTATGGAGTVSRWTPPSNGTENVIYDGQPLSHSGPSLDMLGRWRIFARVKRNTSGDVFSIRGTRSQNGGGVNLAAAPAVFAAPTGAGWAYVDLGVMQVPGSGQWTTDPYGNQFPATAPSVQVRATRVSGSGTLDVDHLLALPGDGRFLAANLNGAIMTTTGCSAHIDGDRNTITVLQSYNSSPYADSIQPPVGWAGGMLRVSPRYQTQLFAIADATSTGSTASVLNVAGSYRPRYLDAL